MRRKELTNCPVCSGDLIVTEYRCPDCRTILRGEFFPLRGELASLTEEQQDFVLKFIRCRGSIKEMEKLLGVSYPTVRGRLDTLIQQLGSEPVGDDRDEILKQLEQGAITADEAVRLLRGGEQQ